MEDRIQRARLRFKSMLESAEQAAEWAAQDRPGVLQPSNLMVAAVKAMNRAGGFLEAVSIIAPELGQEMIDEFETFAAKVEDLNQATQAAGERRTAEGTGSGIDDRRSGDRRIKHDRRRQWTEVPVERRASTHDRRAQWDRRTGRIRELADRRWRAIQH
jgi:hypothetical protein